MAGKGSKPGERRGGRQKGTPNKLPATIRAMILGALDRVGGEEFFVNLAEGNPSAFAVLVGKLLPLQLQGDRDNPLEHRVAFAERQREARAAIDAAFEEREPEIAAPPPAELRGAEGETLPLPRGFTREGELDPTPVPLPARHRAPRAVGGWGG
jgi:hypothetical protein